MTFLAVLWSATAALAQTPITNGYLLYSVSADSDEPGAALLASMGSTLEVAFKEQKTKAVAKIAGATNAVHVIADHAELAAPIFDVGYGKRDDLKSRRKVGARA